MRSLTPYWDGPVSIFECSTIFWWKQLCLLESPDGSKSATNRFESLRISDEWIRIGDSGSWNNTSKPSRIDDEWESLGISDEWVQISDGGNWNNTSKPSRIGDEWVKNWRRMGIVKFGIDVSGSMLVSLVEIKERSYKMKGVTEIIYSGL